MAKLAQAAASKEDDDNNNDRDNNGNASSDDGRKGSEEDDEDMDGNETPSVLGDRESVDDDLSGLGEEGDFGSDDDMYDY